MGMWNNGLTRRPAGVLVDVAVVAASVPAGLWVSASLWVTAPSPVVLAARGAFIAFALICSFVASGALYLKLFRRANSRRAELLRVASGGLLAAGGTGAALLLWPGIPLAQALGEAAASAGLATVGLAVLRGIGGTARREGAIVILADPHPRWLPELHSIQGRLGPGWRLILLRGPRWPGAGQCPPEGLECRPIGDIGALPESGREMLLVIDGMLPGGEGAAGLISNAYLRRASIMDMAEFYEEVLEKAPVFEERQGWSAKPRFTRPTVPYLAAKRALDLAVALPLLALSAPFLVVFAALIRWESPGPALFRQQRVGLGGREFTMLKLRTMEMHSDDAARWPHFAAAKVTRIGAFLRRSGLDELPQLLNVIRGDMSLAGPRPARPAVTARHIARNPFYAAACSVRPGVSGWAQLHLGQDAGDHTMFEKARYNLYYAAHRSLSLDLLIFIRTFWKLLLGRKPESVYLAELHAMGASERGAAACPPVAAKERA